MTDWKIRAATPDDATGIQRCMHAAYSVYLPRMGDFNLPPLEADYAAEIEDFPVWVAEANGSIVGGLIMSFDENHATLVNVAVSPDFQGHGLGRGLLDFAEAEAKQRGFSRLQLATHTLLTENLAIYKHLGWELIDKNDFRVFFEKGLI